MSGETRLLKNTLILFIGVVGTRLINFIMLPFYTSWLSVEEYGRIDIFVTIVSMCVPFLTLQLEQAVFRFMLEDELDEDYRITVSSGIACLFGSLLFVNTTAGVFLAITKEYNYILYLVAVNLQSIYVMEQQIIRGKGQNHIYTENSILLSVINVGFSIVFIYGLRLGVHGYIFAFCLAHIVAIFFMAIKSKINYMLRASAVRVEKVKELLRYSLPMIVNNVSWWILNASDKLLINFFLGAEANGIYAAAGKLPGLITTVYTVFQMAWQEEASRKKEGNPSDYFSEIFRKLFGIILYFVIVMLLCGRILFGILISSKFENSYNHIPILLVGLFFLCISQFYGGIYVGFKKSEKLGWTSATAAIINFVVDLLAIREIGIYAASISTLVAYALLCLVRLFSIKKICTIKYRKKEILISIATLIVAFIVAYSTNLALQLGTLVVITSLLFTLYKDILMSTMKEIMIKMRGKIR